MRPSGVRGGTGGAESPAPEANVRYDIPCCQMVDWAASILASLVILHMALVIMVAFDISESTQTMMLLNTKIHKYKWPSLLAYWYKCE